MSEYIHFEIKDPARRQPYPSRNAQILWNHHFHHTRLYLILKGGIKWNYNYPPLPGGGVDQYKTNQVEEIISPPLVFSHGKSQGWT
jgi:hypothetical protein